MSNEGGNTSLRVVTVPGGAIETVTPTTRRYLRPHGTLRLAVTDAAGARDSRAALGHRRRRPGLGARRRVAPRRRRLRPRQRADTRSHLLPHAAAPRRLTLPAGSYTVEASRGPRVRAGHAGPSPSAPGGTAGRAAHDCERLVDLPARGWWSGDLHVHMNYGGDLSHRPRPAPLSRRRRKTCTWWRI